MLLATEPCEDFFVWRVVDDVCCGSSCSAGETFSWGLDEGVCTSTLSRVKDAVGTGSSSCDPFPSGATSLLEEDCSGASSSSSSIK